MFIVELALLMISTVIAIVTDEYWTGAAPDPGARNTETESTGSPTSTPAETVMKESSSESAAQPND